MNILVTGGNGQLGSELKHIAFQYPQLNCMFTDVEELDITNQDDIISYVEEHNVGLIINCAAYTAVDKAESDIERARIINATAVKNLIKACELSSAKLIHISTDYVFNGEAFCPLKESDQVIPLGVYGLTKLEGEQYVVSSNEEGIIIRTSWLYSSFGNNFVKTMMRLGVERESLGVIFDQVGTPTYAADLAGAIMSIINSNEKLDKKGKVYHYSNEGVASWYDFALAIFELSGIKCIVNPIEASEYPTPAKRPYYSVLNKKKIKNDFNISIPYWRDSLRSCLYEIEKSN
ncbi:dTDP-4-dehydrorhamnose reductase [Plebeiibacterium sediminum]|uniref:dTDP-4-dehydrorhamnose reductase n=1 Tax=Plebeiibacterium sediminum TaxID=2992112 RepID=A0AAE3M4N4_9BACT|nr:dTDP-4-dehydrorhamnose reductase [Plebeiobacterium sediminum]MCW3786755.1 dTDP-4-dehydrorhamnose reductase [Plebeiobacterium sediminum]